MQTSWPAALHMQRVSVSDPAHSNANPLVCLTFQWCSGHLNSIFCRCCQHWGPCQGEPPRQLRRQQNKERGSSCISRNLFKNTPNTRIAFFNPPSLSFSRFGICFSDACGGWGGMSVIFASGEMLFQGRQLIKVSDKCWGGNLRFTFPPGGEKLPAVALTLGLSTCFFFC